MLPQTAAGNFKETLPMKTKLLYRTMFVAAFIAAALAFVVPRAVAQTVRDDIEVARGLLKADRKIVIAEEMQLSDQESTNFWPLYREYRAAADKVNDGRVELVLEYADIYPNVTEAQAKALLKRYTRLEEQALEVRHKYLKKLGKVLPAAKVLRFAQLESRLDLAVSLQIAGAVPLVPPSADQK